MATKSANLSAISIDISRLSEEQMNLELEKGYSDLKAARTKPASKVFADSLHAWKKISWV